MASIPFAAENGDLTLKETDTRITKNLNALYLEMQNDLEPAVA